MRQQTPISNVKTIPGRHREDFGNIDSLADSIRRYGLIQPIVVDPSFNLVAGERRLRACTKLGMDSIDYVFVAEVPEDIRAELEFEENYRRKQFTWQEEALGILDIYEKKKRAGALGGFQENWQQTISEMFSMSIGTANYILRVAVKLRAEKNLPEDQRKYWKFNSVSEAYRLGLIGEAEDAANAELARRAKSKLVAHTPAQQASNILAIQEVKQAGVSETTLTLAKEKYESNPLNEIPFEVYWEEKKKLVNELENVVFLSNQLINTPCIEFMLDPDNKERFDHIITDPPYGIDMDNLNQQNVHGGMMDIDTVVEEHQVDENLQLLAKFFPAAFHCTKERAFVCVCGDYMRWQFMYDQAISAGFVVQRWPYIWRKVNQSVMNNCAGYNTTKDHELVMICRKPGTTLFEKRNTSFTDASNNEVTKLTGHPFAKPFELTRDLVQMVSMKGQSILDPFAGGGSMVIQMLKMERYAFGLEKNEKHFNSLVENVKNQYYLKLNPKLKFR